jgi:molybdopterin-guanine dinucleotide biosynthesis protein A
MATVKTIGALLAGGLARRMGGGDKPLTMLAGEPMLARAIARLAPQCDELILNANGDPARFKTFSLMVVADTVPGFAGPLAGVLAALDWTAAKRSQAEWVVSAPTDCPFLPSDLVERLHRARQDVQAQLAVAASGGRSHPVVGLWPVALREEIRHALTVEDERKVDRFTARYRLATVSWPADPVDPFFNVNTADDLAMAERLARREAAPKT